MENEILLRVMRIDLLNKSSALRIMGIALRLARQCKDSGLVKYWFRNTPGNMYL